MIKLSYLPLFIRAIFNAIPYSFRYRHKLVLQWAIIMHILAPGPKTFVGMARFAPKSITEWRFRNFMNAGYWSAKLVMFHLVSSVVSSFPPPADGIVYVIADGSEKDKRGTKNPLAQKGKKSKSSFYFFGIKFVVLMISWDVYRIPVDFEIIKPKTDSDYINENALFRKMLKQFNPPEWAHTVIVSGDCAYASKDNMNLILKLDEEDGTHHWYFVFAIAKTWNMANGKQIKNLAKYTPRSCYKQTWIPHLSNSNRRKTFWTFTKKAQLKHIGNVTIVLSKKGRNVGPNKTKILVTNLPCVTARTVLCIYQRRWQVEILFKELKSGIGLGQQQVTGHPPRIEKSFALGFIAYLVLILAQKDDIQPGKPWSIFQLKHNFMIRVVKDQVEHDTKIEMKKWAKLNQNKE